MVVLEAGPYLDRDDLSGRSADRARALYRDGGLTIAEGRPAIPVPVGRAVGGTTVINSGTCFRAPEHVLRALARSSTGSTGRRELDPDYAEAEEMLHVTPVDAERMGRNGQLLMEGAEALGASGGADPAQRGALRQLQLLPRAAAGSTRSGRCTSPTCRARSRPARGSAPASRRGG